VLVSEELLSGTQFPHVKPMIAVAAPRRHASLKGRPAKQAPIGRPSPTCVAPRYHSQTTVGSSSVLLYTGGQSSNLLSGIISRWNLTRWAVFEIRLRSELRKRVHGTEFRTMKVLPNGRQICDGCGHIIFPNDRAFKCPCQRRVEVDFSPKLRGLRR
jgi:hypothetical protein